MLKVTVKRSQWYRGHGQTGSRLLIDPDEKHSQFDEEAVASGHTMCCLGFACLAAGVPKGNLLNVSYPWTVHYDGELLPHLEDCREAYRKMAVENDDPIISDTERERILTEQGLAVGIQFTFVD